MKVLCLVIIATGLAGPAEINEAALEGKVLAESTTYYQVDFTEALTQTGFVWDNRYRSYKIEKARCIKDLEER